MKLTNQAVFEFSILPGTLKLAIRASFILALTGCSGFLPPKHQAMLDSIPVCCEDFSGIAFRDLSTDQKIRQAVGPDTPSFKFPEGKSFFLAIRLLKDFDPHLIVRTYPQNTLYNPNAHVFVPRLTLLTDQFELISSVTPVFIVKGPRFGIGESYWQADISVPSSAVYAVIHTSNEERNRIMQMPDNEQPGGYLYIQTGPAGEIEVELD